jgi:hypothetical protein
MNIRKSGAPARKTSRKGGVDYGIVRELAVALPDVQDSSTLRGIAFKARGKLLACKAVHRSAEPESLMVRVAAIDRDRLIAATPEIYYLTPHYLLHSSVLVRLKLINRKALQSLLRTAWQFVTASGTTRGKKSAT